MASSDAVTMLDDEHNQAIRLFERYKSERDDRQRLVLAPQICRELEVHMAIEEEIFYPAYRQATGDEEVLKDAREEHDEARQLIARIRDDGRDAALMLELEDAILHHVNDEREKMFPRARGNPRLDLRKLAVQMEARRNELTAGLPA